MPTLNYSRVVDAGAGWTKVETPDGRSLTVKGDRAMRNNNPGNIEYGNFARSHGAIGTDGRFAVFGSREAGLKAQAGLLFGNKSYQNLTLAQAISRYAPEFENNTAAYAATVAAMSGIPLDTLMKDVPLDKRNAVLEAMHYVEGNTKAKAYDAETGALVETIDGRTAAKAANPNRYEAPVEAELAPGPLPSNAPQRGNTLAEAYAQYGASRALAPEKPVGWSASPFRPDNIDIGGPNFMSAPLGRVERGPALAAPERLGMGGYTPPAPSPAYGGPANRPMPSGRISVPAAPSALGRSLATRTKDDRVSITGSAPSALGRPGAQMSPNGANRTKDDNARSLSPAAPSALGTTIGRGGYSPPGSGFKAENVDRGLLGADPAPARQAAGTPTAGYEPTRQAAGTPTAGYNPSPMSPNTVDRTKDDVVAAPAKTSPALAPDALERALAVRNELQNIKDLSQTVPALATPPAAVIAPALVPRPPVQPRPVVVAPAPQAMPSRPVAPALRPSDIYGGTIGSALDNTGKNTVSRDAFGNTTVTNQWGVTTGMTPGGYQTAYGSMGALPGITGPTASKIGGAVKGALPGIAGSTVGGLLGGPIGALLGAALAKAATQPGGILSGTQSFNTNAFGTINAAKAQGGGAFPNAPATPAGARNQRGFDTQSDRDHAYGMSPGAAANIDAGRTGLY